MKICQAGIGLDEDVLGNEIDTVVTRSFVRDRD